MVGAGGFEPPTPRPPGKRQATSKAAERDNVLERGTSTRTTRRSGPPRSADAGQEAAKHVEPRYALVRALTGVIVRALRADDAHTAHVAYEALGRVIAEHSPEATDHLSAASAAPTRRARHGK